MTEHTPTIAESATIARARPLMEAPLGRDLVGLNVDTGLCYGFNETAAAIWRHLERPLPFSDLLAGLSEEFDATAEECRDDVSGLVRRLADEGLVTVTAAP